MRAKFTMPHPGIVTSGPQLLAVIAQLEAGTYPQPEDAIWRGDLPADLAVRLARATGATDDQIAEFAEPLSTCGVCDRPVFAGQRVDNYAGSSHYGCVHG